MNTSPSTADVQRACTVLSSPALIRLITEIDDNGPIPPRGLTRILSDLAPHQIRDATDQAHALGLVRARQGLGLTESGIQAAEVYDEAARWARTHHYPEVTSSLVTRVRATLRLLGDTAGPAPSPAAASSLTAPKTALEAWITTHTGADRTSTELLDAARNAA
ncbi:hypothetical protein ACFV9D_05940 [Streptomyces sp. NPDC059875]|uniref:hypothetical protein n=1 Tax=unclassified Streptomyces TaxID=2593676 RepID=UPI00366A1E0F